jgi:hypothetical protein
MEWLRELLKHANSRHGLLALVFAILAAPLGHYFYVQYEIGQDKKVPVIVTFVDGTPVAYASVAADGHVVGVTNECGCIEVPQSTHTLQIFLGHEALLIQISPPNNFKGIANVDVSDNMGHTLIIKPPAK